LELLSLFVPPVIGDPGNCLHRVVSAFSLVALDGGMGIGAPVEGEHFGAGGKPGGDEMIERPGWAAVTFEAAHPVIGPEFHALLDAVSEVSLGRVEIGESMFAFGVVLVDDMLAGAGFEPEDGGVSDLRAATEEFFAALDPVVDDADLVETVVEEAVDVVGDEKIEIEEHAVPGKAGQLVLKECKLEPSGGLEPVWKFKGGQWKGLDAIVESSVVVGEAQETKRSCEVASHTVEEAVDIVRTVTGAPLEGEDVDGISGGIGHE
jgi:hypothetical protein